MHYLSEQYILVFLIQIFVLLGLARLLGELCREIGEPPLVGEIAAGVILGPTILGRFLPVIQRSIFPPDPVQQNMLQTVSWLGVMFLLLATGLEVDVSAACGSGAPA
jgi:Kef-type K+ transport system membrane component KefB